MEYDLPSEIRTFQVTQKLQISLKENLLSLQDECLLYTSEIYSRIEIM